MTDTSPKAPQGLPPMSETAESAAGDGALEQVAQDRLDTLHNILQERLSPVLDSFLRSSQNNIGLLRSSLDEADRETLNRAAHSLKGSAANYSAETLRAVCESLETDSYEAIPDDAASRIEQISTLFIDVKAGVNAWREARGLAIADDVS